MNIVLAIHPKWAKLIYEGKKNIDEEVGECLLVMGRDDTEWHEPTIDYMGIEQ